MARPSVDREAIGEFVNEYVYDTGRRPGARLVASHFNCSPQTAQAAMAGLDAKGMLDGSPLRPKRMVDHRRECLRAIRAYQMTHTWAPSQREIAEMLGVTTSRANAIIERLAAEGELIVGPYPRQLVIAGTTIDIPEVEES